MNITLISRQKNLYQVKAVGDRIAEYYKDSRDKNQLRIRIFHPAQNTVCEISPEKRKTDRIPIINCIYDCQDLYYTCIERVNEDSVEISIYKYMPSGEKEQKICTFIKGLEWMQRDRRIKLFLLNENTILMQTEIDYGRPLANRMGSIAFTLSLFNLENAEETEVTEANFTNNGIDQIIPLSDKKILIKTGYSHLDDDRIDPDDKDQAYIESVYITTTAKFIADIILKKDFVDMPLIESAYFDNHITIPEVSGDYVHFSVTDISNRTLKCIFYNYQSEERLEYLIKDYNPRDIYVTYVIQNTPYIRKSAKGQVDFINLKKAQIDISFYNEFFLDQQGSLFILQAGARKRRLRLYSYPKLVRVLDEDHSYLFCCAMGDNHYIYC